MPAGTHTDPGQTGLQLRVRALRDGKASRAWLLRLKFRGQETRILLGHPPQMTLDAARGEARRLRELADQGIDPRRARVRRRLQTAPLPLSSDLAPGDRHSVAFMVSEFTTRYLRVNRKRPEQAEWMLGVDVLPAWKGRDARTISSEEVIELLNGIVDRGAPVLANRTAALMNLMFKFAVQQRIVPANPVQLLLPPGGKEKARKRVLSDEELRAYLAAPLECAAEPKLAHVITLLLLTGQRRGELAKAAWHDVSLTARIWRIPDENVGKTDEGHIVPLTPWAVREFKALKRLAGNSPWVLPTEDGKHHAEPALLTRGLARCLKRFKAQGIKAFKLHDIRRTCRTGLAALKVPPHVAERVLNHAQPGMIGVYDQHTYLEEKHAALVRWTWHLRKLRRLGAPRLKPT